MAFLHLISTEKKVIGAVSGWSTCDIDITFCMKFHFYALQETDRWTSFCDEPLCMVQTMVVQPFCARGTLMISAVHGLAMSDAPPLSWFDDVAFSSLDAQWSR